MEEAIFNSTLNQSNLPEIISQVSDVLYDSVNLEQLMDPDFLLTPLPADIFEPSNLASIFSIYSYQ